MTLSTLPMVILLIYGAFWFQINRLFRQGKLDITQKIAFAMMLCVLLFWALILGNQSSRGLLTTTAFQELAPGYWLPFVPVVVVVLGLLLSPALRTGIVILLDETPAHWLSGVHLLRILAVGSMIKASYGLFPASFAIYVGVPDLLFGLSAVFVTWQARRNRLSERFLCYWHLTGALVILAPVLGLMQLFIHEPLFSALFEFPMVLALGFVVPTLVMLNLLAAGRLIQRSVLQGR